MGKDKYSVHLDPEDWVWSVFDGIRQREGFTTRKAAIMRLLIDAVNSNRIMPRRRSADTDGVVDHSKIEEYKD